MDVLGYQAGVVAPVICERLLDHCLNKNSKDNMSVCLVVLPGAPSAIPGYAVPEIAAGAADEGRSKAEQQTGQ
jgi:serine/threonine protein phosphatase PrpC